MFGYFVALGWFFLMYLFYGKAGHHGSLVLDAAKFFHSYCGSQWGFSLHVNIWPMGH